MQGECSECGITIPITLMARATEHSGKGLIVEVEPDLTDAVAHAWTHEQ